MYINCNTRLHPSFLWDMFFPPFSGQYSAKLLKKPDQCRAVYACSHLFWVDDQDGVKDGERWNFSSPFYSCMPLFMHYCGNHVACYSFFLHPWALVLTYTNHTNFIPSTYCNTITKVWIPQIVLLISTYSNYCCACIYWNQVKHQFIVFFVF